MEEGQYSADEVIVLDPPTNSNYGNHGNYGSQQQPWQPPPLPQRARGRPRGRPRGRSRGRPPKTHTRGPYRPRFVQFNQVPDDVSVVNPPLPTGGMSWQGQSGEISQPMTGAQQQNVMGATPSNVMMGATPQNVMMGATPQNVTMGATQPNGSKGATQGSTCTKSKQRPNLSWFSDEEIFDKLVERQHIFVCVCSCVFLDRVLYEIHRSSHDPKNPRKCSSCQYVAPEWTDFLQHFINHKQPCLS